jgi:hypothetical protein
MIRSIVLTLAFGLMAGISPLSAQAPTELPALRGLAPVTVLMKSYAGKAALGANYAVTGGIQAGTYVQPTLLPLAEERQQALRDVFITDGDLAQLADGLGTTLGAAYLARAHYIDRTNYTSISQGVADLIAYTDSVTETDSNAGKRWHSRYLRPQLRPSCGKHGRRQVRRCAALSNRAQPDPDQRTGLLQHTGR